MNLNPRFRRNIPIYMILLIVVIIMVVLLIASGGGEPIGEIPIQSAQVTPVIPETTKVLTEESRDFLTEISPDGAVFTFSQETASLRMLKPGDIIVSDVTDVAPNGYLRRVEQVLNQNGQIIVETGPAVLADAIETASVHFTKIFTPADIKSGFKPPGLALQMAPPAQDQEKFYIKFDNVVFEDVDQNPSTTEDQILINGDITFDMSIDVDVLFQSFELREFSVIATTTQDASIEVISNLDRVGLGYVKTVASIPLNQFTIPVGHLPIVFQPIIRLQVGLDGKVTTELHTSIAEHAELKVGGEIKNGHGSPIGEFDISFQHTTPSYSKNSDLAVKGSVGPHLALLVYGVVGPTIDIRGYLELVIKPLNNPFLELFGGFHVDVGIKLEVFSRAIAGFKATVIDKKWLLFSLSTPPTDTPALAVTQTYLPLGTATPGSTFINTGTPPVFGGNAHTVMVFDISGSMEQLDQTGIPKIDAARNAGNNILNIMEAEAQSTAGFTGLVGLVQFSSTARISSPLTTIIAEARNTLNQFRTSGSTAMAGGLRLGIDLLGSSGASQARKVMILLSDGLPNVMLNGEGRGDYDPSVRQEILDLAHEAGRQGICIYTVGFGEPLAGGGSIDVDLLREITAASGCGAYYSAQDAVQLANVYVELRHTSTGNVLLKQSGEISQGQEINIGTVNLPEYQSQILFTLNWPNDRLEPVLIDPNSQIVDANYPGASLSTFSSLASIIVRDPIAGQWVVSARGVDIPNGSTSYNAVLSSRPSPYTPTPTNVPATPTPQPAALPSPSFPVVILVLVLGGGGIALYALAKITARGRSTIGMKQSPAGSTKLIGQTREISGRSYLLLDGMTVGRSKSCQIQLSTPGVSRQHARLRYSQGHWYIQDMNSKTGTYVNGKRVAASALKNGDLIRVGSYEFRFLR